MKEVDVVNNWLNSFLLKLYERYYKVSDSSMYLAFFFIISTLIFMYYLIN